MIPEKVVDTIKIISSKLKENGIDYAIIGSGNCALQGMDLTPRDLDLVVRLDDLKKMPEIFKEYSPSEVEKLFPDSKDPAWTAKLEKHPAYNVYFYIEGVEVQILGEEDDGDYVSKLLAKKIILVSLKGNNLPCFTLETEAEVYAQTFRPEKAKRIRDFIDLQSHSQD